jgi:hypothetical protein
VPTSGGTEASGALPGPFEYRETDHGDKRDNTGDACRVTGELPVQCKVGGRPGIAWHRHGYRRYRRDQKGNQRATSYPTGAEQRKNNQRGR